MTDELKTIKLEQLKPYWRNPRTGDVESVKQSIKDYGYNQYIVVDKNLVIIVGHTRYKALQELALEDPKYKEVPVLVSALNEKQAKEYRIFDNQTGDKSEWILDKLSQELREIDTDISARYFPTDELDRLVKANAGVDYKPVSIDQIDKQQNKMDSQMTNNDERRQHIAKLVICPECDHEFEVQ